MRAERFYPSLKFYLFIGTLGSEKADVVNCKTGGTLEKLEIGTFWRGFESVEGMNYYELL